jgi:hypothetical protein
MPTESPGAETSLERLSPDDLVSSFSKSHLIRWFLVALGLHALVIGGLSLGTIRDLVDPEGAKARREAAVALRRWDAAAVGRGRTVARRASHHGGRQPRGDSARPGRSRSEHRRHQPAVMIP